MSDPIARFGPQIAPVVVNFLLGLVAGRIARRMLTKTILIGGGIVLALAAFGVISLDLPTVQGWADSGSGWMKDNLEGPAQYVVALLPSAAAATAGATLGFRGGGRREGFGPRGAPPRPALADRSVFHGGPIAQKSLWAPSSWPARPSLSTRR